MLERLIHALVNSTNEAADDLLVEALRLGSEQEQAIALDALLKRQSVHGLSGVVGHFDRLPERLQLHVLEQIGEFHPALRECGRSDTPALRLAAMKLIA